MACKETKTSSPMRALLGNARGMTIIYVIAALLLATFVGAGLMKMAGGESTASGDYAAMTSASIAAGSGAQTVQTWLLDNMAAAVVIVNAFVAAGNNTPVNILGTEAAPLTLIGDQKYWVSLVGVEKANWNLHFRVVGWGKGGSKKEAHVFYRLTNTVLNTPMNVPTNALYLGSGNNPATSCFLQVNGATFARAPFSGGGTANLRFQANGPFHLSDTVLPGGPTGTISLDGFRSDSAAYFGRPVSLDQNFNTTGGGFYGPTFFNKDVTVGGSQDVIMGGNCWFNGNMTGATDPHSKHIHLYNGSIARGLTSKAYTDGFIYCNVAPGTWSNLNHGTWVPPTKQAAPYDPQTALGFTAHVDPPEVNMTIPAAALAVEVDAGVTGNGELQTLSGTSPLFNGFAVVRASGMGGDDGTGASATGISGRVIVRVTAPWSDGDPGASKYFHTSGTGIIVLFVDIGAANSATLRIGNPFNGLIYIKSGNVTTVTAGGSPPSGGTVINGAFYAAPGTQPTIGGSGGGGAQFNWNQDIMDAIAGLGAYGAGGNNTLNTFAGSVLQGLQY